MNYYQLTYNELGERKKYLNGTSWKSSLEAEIEFRRILKHVIEMEKKGINHIRSDYQLERIRNKKRTVIKKLNIWER